MRFELVVVAMLLAPYPAQAAPLFVNRAKQLNLAEQYKGGREFFVGGSGQMWDMEASPRLDLFFLAK